ncbi:Glutathione-s-transferase theta [Taphrina deformans PYCC 5710]|uniref:Glutathione-s-transferase theta n=1 Tax=Taphrina deformans (strain PYCC 5710 / ATCC 11124 / CBS 356.35 / IMI 108563 / JCM 9778 / NBRC 8474) TaxID=1097556 RepID=R4XC60_TAPDE|nr:Glutathione-s-transferase theta [Taphrina deformans PYCC 5710]|eukprot:CCG83462.1 Glutathione-s-transferase theta [Taphrina deformans PYCC 5710]
MASANASANLKPMTVFTHSSGPNPKKVLLVLEALKIPYKTEDKEFGDGPNGVKNAEFLKLNPNGRVPALIDPNQDNIVVWESGAILMYLEKFYDQGNTIGSTDLKKQIEINAWLFFQVSGLGPAQGQVNWFTHFHDSKNEDALKRYRNETDRCYQVLDKQIGSQKYICGDKFTLADAAFYPWVATADFAKISRPSNVQRWFEEVSKLDFVKKVYGQ